MQHSVTAAVNNATLMSRNLRKVVVSRFCALHIVPMSSVKPLHIGSVKGMTSQQLQDLDCHVILGNTYHLENRPTSGLIAEFGGLHSFINWPRGMLTDSGGFQVLPQPRPTSGRQNFPTEPLQDLTTSPLDTPSTAVDVEMQQSA